MARAALGWTVRDLAAAAGLHRNTISNIETGRHSGDNRTLEAIEAALTKAGVEFISSNADKPGVQLNQNKEPMWVQIL